MRLALLNNVIEAGSGLVSVATARILNIIRRLYIDKFLCYAICFYGVKIVSD